MKYSIEKLKELRAKLPHGSQALIADELNLSAGQVYSVFCGRSTNEKVIELGIRLIKEAKEAQIKKDKELDAKLDVALVEALTA